MTNTQIIRFCKRLEELGWNTNLDEYDILIVKCNKCEKERETDNHKFCPFCGGKYYQFLRDDSSYESETIEQIRDAYNYATKDKIC